MAGRGRASRNRIRVPGRGRGPQPGGTTTAVVASFGVVVLGLAACTGGTASPPAQSGSVTLRAVDGGSGHYSAYDPALPSGEDFFPVGVWFESVRDTADVQSDTDAGLNTYVNLTADSDLDLVREAGMWAIHGYTGDVGEETVGWLLPDETDMWAGPGDGPWTGSYPGEGEICSDGAAGCGYTVQATVSAEFPDDDRFQYANYGKGVLFWQSTDDAARFVNDYPDVISADAYWYTDQNICGPTEGGVLLGTAGLPLAEEVCHRAANYGLTIDRVRELVEPAGSRPVWAFVELGHPFTEDHWPSITPAQVRAAVWSSLIHGARGVVYFNHSFGGECETHHVLREECYTPIRRTVSRLNAQIARLAPMLNAPFVDGMTSTDGPADAATKFHDGSVYVLAGATAATGGRVTFTLDCFDDATVTVLDESRSLAVEDGTFADDFADGEAVHLYRVDAPPSCRLN